MAGVEAEEDGAPQRPGKPLVNALNLFRRPGLVTASLRVRLDTFCKAVGGEIAGTCPRRYCAHGAKEIVGLPRMISEPIHHGLNVDWTKAGDGQVAPCVASKLQLSPI